MGLFDFMDMAYNYEDRKVDNYKDENLCVDTCYVSDCGDKCYETAVSHPLYNNSDWVVVENYETKEEAQLGHDKWVEIMTKNPPSVLVDTMQAEVARFEKVITGNDRIFEKSMV